MNAAQHKRSGDRPPAGACAAGVPLLAGGAVTELNSVTSDGFARIARAPRRPALRISRRSAPLLRKAALRLGASG